SCHDTIVTSGGSGISYLFSDKTGILTSTYNGCTIKVPLSIIYPSQNKYTTKQSGNISQNPTNCLTSNPTEFDPDTVTEETYDYSISGNTLTVTQEGDD